MLTIRKTPRRLLFTLAALVAAPVAQAKPPIAGGLLERVGDQANARNDLEGGIWEYKVIERTGDRNTVMVGKLRIKQSAAFDVPGSASGSLIDDGPEGEQAGAGGPPLPFGSGSKPGRQPRLGVLDRISESNRGGERIADLNYEKSRNSTNATPKVTFRFDTDDDHPLSGDANVKYDTRGGGGVWRGTYTEKKADGKKTRWKFELRFIED